MTAEPAAAFETWFVVRLDGGNADPAALDDALRVALATPTDATGTPTTS